MEKGKNLKINCDVVNCAYHEGECTCTADTVKVGPKAACRCEQTCCDSFREKFTPQG